MANKYDYIIAGGGCSGLMLALGIHESRLKDKSVLIIDNDQKDKNDRTWCFWERGENKLEDIVHKTWSVAKFYGNGFVEDMEIAPYKYKMIRGIDFYTHVFDSIQKNPKIKRLNATIKEVDGNGLVITDKGEFIGEIVFNSYYKQEDLHLPKSSINVLQHFKGWVIRTPNDVFDPDKMTYMDFRVSKDIETKFGYVLPFTSKEALVEYTLFTEALLKDEIYDQALKNYIEEILEINAYEIVEEEFGIIPMTDYKFPRTESEKVINIGTLGGQTKASTGYTFLRIQKGVQQIVSNLEKGAKPLAGGTSWDKRFKFYDSILLNVLSNETYPIKDVFTEMFAKHGPQMVFKFLDEETSLWEEMQLMNLKPKRQFTKAFFQQLVKINRI